MIRYLSLVTLFCFTQFAHAERLSVNEAVIDVNKGDSQSAELNLEEEWGDDWGDEPVSNWSPLTGFTEIGYGQRFNTDEVLTTDTTLNDLRYQGQLDYQLPQSTIKSRFNLYYDGVQDNVTLQIRELAWQGALGGRWDAKLGQQVLTWGTGDYLFLNDLFPKDWQSFFSGRDDEYLKAPSLSAKFSGYYDLANIDLVITPRFTSDTYINGEYFSFFSPIAATQNGGINIAPEFSVKDKNKPKDAELALRVSKNVHGTEFALYGYWGYQKTPNGVDAQFEPKFHRLNVYGASVISQLGAGLARAEFAYNQALDDKKGEDALVANSLFKALVSYEQELITNLTGSVQWYLEQTQDYDAYMASSPAPQWVAKENRQLVTAQLYYRLMKEKLKLQWFNFYSPSDKDGYIRIKASYSPDDKWQFVVGTNYFYGDQTYTFFGQFEDASNGYASVRYYF